MKTKIISTDKIVLDKNYYPRLGYDFVTGARYYNAMKSGAVFPPIVVSLIDGKYHLVDGRHRLSAYKSMKQRNVTCEVINLKSLEELYLEAVKRNIGHGRQFSTQEVAQICITLENWKFAKTEIAEIVKMPLAGLTKFVAARAVRIIGENGKEGGLLAVKNQLSNLSGTSQAFEFEQEQKSFTGESQSLYLDNFIKLLRNNWFDTNNKDIVLKLKAIKKLINKLV